MKIEAVIFDIGNVLLLFDYMRSASRLIAKNQPETPPDPDRVTAWIHQYECGQMSRAEFLASVRPEFADTGAESEFLSIWENIFEENLPMTALARELSAEVPVFLISNIGDIHLEFIRRQFDVFRVFRDGVYSFEAGLLKPDPRVFQLARTRFGVDPAATIYFDDLAANCEAAASEGFLAHHYDHTKHHEARDWVELNLG
ncbi:MAG: HAD family hydrolase [Terrimicrobiaceae bacterium]